MADMDGVQKARVGMVESEVGEACKGQTIKALIEAVENLHLILCALENSRGLGAEEWYDLIYFKRDALSRDVGQV